MADQVSEPRLRQLIKTVNIELIDQVLEGADIFQAYKAEEFDHIYASLHYSSDLHETLLLRFINELNLLLAKIAYLDKIGAQPQLVLQKLPIHASLPTQLMAMVPHEDKEVNEFLASGQNQIYIAALTIDGLD